MIYLTFSFIIFLKEWAASLLCPTVRLQITVYFINYPWLEYNSILIVIVISWYLSSIYIYQYLKGDSAVTR